MIDYSEFNAQMLDTEQALIVTGMPNGVYHSLPGISKSGLDLIARSPAHYAFREYSEPTRAMAIGSAAHAAVFEPHIFERDYLLLKDVTDRRSSEYKQAVKTHKPEFVLTANEVVSVRSIQSAIMQNAPAMALLNSTGESELSVFARDPVHGVLCKARFDWITSSGYAVDLKTTQDLRDFARSVANYRYHVQQAWYDDVWLWATGERLAGFDFLACEKDLPCANRLIRLDTPSVDYGRKLAHKALATYAQCIASDEWPMPTFEPEYITLPAWAADPEQYEDY